MNAQQLFTAEGEATSVWFCERCQRSAYGQDAAERCCRCSYCGEPVEANRIVHGECQTRREVEVLAERIEKAQKLASWEGWVFWEGYGSKDGFFPSLEEFVLSAQGTGRELPQWVFVCEESPFNGPSMDDIQSNAESEGYEDIWADVEGADELEKAIDTFNELNAGRVTYHPDFGRVVAVSRSVAEKLDAANRLALLMK